jgi:hypothetical protein
VCVCVCACEREYKTYFLILNDHGQKVLGSSVLKKIFGSKGGEIRRELKAEYIVTRNVCAMGYGKKWIY